MSVSIETLALAKKFTKTAVAESIGSLTKYEFSVKDELPISGTPGIIYLIPSSDGSDAPYDSYIYENSEFVKIPGPKHTDISKLLEEYRKAEEQDIIDSELKNKISNYDYDVVYTTG